MKKSIITIALLVMGIGCAKMHTAPKNKTTQQVNDSLAYKFGNAVFWTPTANCNLFVKVDNRTRVTSTWDAKEPECGVENHINEYLKVGDYAYTAYLVKYTKNSSDSVIVSGNFTVAENKCTKIKIQ